jgi:hypothetical protein
MADSTSSYTACHLTCEPSSKSRLPAVCLTPSGQLGNGLPYELRTSLNAFRETLSLRIPGFSYPNRSLEYAPATTAKSFRLGLAQVGEEQAVIRLWDEILPQE